MSERSDLTRSYAFEVTRSAEDGDGLTLEGYASVFDSPTEINERGGQFIERIKPGAFTRSLNRRMPVLMFNHGQHPLIGDMPLGVIQHAKEDRHGLFIRARLASNWLIEPVREAIASKAVDGMSFRFSVAEGGEQWHKSATAGGLDERDITELNCVELGPVVFPAYADTTVGVRSAEVRELLEDPDVRVDLARALMLEDERADKQPYGDVAYADPGYQKDGQKRYPINTAAHAKAAWAYINQEKNQAPYTPEQVSSIKSRIMAACKKFGVTVASDEMKSQEDEAEHRVEDDFDLGDVEEEATPDGLATDGAPDGLGGSEADLTEEVTPGRAENLDADVRRLERLMKARALGV